MEGYVGVNCVRRDFFLGAISKIQLMKTWWLENFNQTRLLEVRN